MGSLEYTICTLMDKRMDMSLFDEKYCNDEMESSIRSSDSAESGFAG